MRQVSRSPGGSWQINVNFLATLVSLSLQGRGCVIKEGDGDEVMTLVVMMMTLKGC